MKLSFRDRWLGLAATAGSYKLSVLPVARRELGRWRLVAADVPDPVLRRAAMEAVTAKAGNSEATAVLATLAPRPARGSVIRASIALQVAIDYLDCLGEEPGPDPLGDGLALHAALGTALGAEERSGDWYSQHPQREDGGHLQRLVTACRQAAMGLPSAAAILPLARRAALRCGEGQSHTHAAGQQGPEALRAWAEGMAAPGRLEWWEVAAGASSSVAAHALLALAGAGSASTAAGELVDAAYFPGMGALTVLLDDLADREGDMLSGQHNYLAYYPSAESAAQRIEAIVAATQVALRRLDKASLHLAILAGILAFYLSSAAATPAAKPIRDRLLASSDPAVKTLIRIPGIA
jgi:tetraprenyl-beta-curcumene synthase